VIGVVGGLVTSGCVTPVGSQLQVPKDAAAQCAKLCAEIGMRLSAVAIMASNVGCVCQRSQTAAVSDESAATTGGMATLLMQQQAQQRAQQAQQAQRSQAMP